MSRRVKHGAYASAPRLRAEFATRHALQNTGPARKVLQG